MRFKMIVIDNYTSHYITQHTIGCQYHLYKQNYTAVDVTNRFQHGKENKKGKNSTMKITKATS